MGAPLVSLTDARGVVLSHCPILPVVQIDLADATGCVLAEQVIAPEDVPPFANSAVDGYAVVSADLISGECELPVIGEVAAGAPADLPLHPGAAIRIMTGAPLPAGADAVVMVENTVRLDDGRRVRITATASRGQAIRSAGDDIAAGTVAFGAGTFIRPAVAGVLASVNARSVTVIPRCRVAVLSPATN